MKVLVLAIAIVLLSGCGNIKRMWSGWTGDPVMYCYRGVAYLQFPSGATVMYARNGLVVSCD